MTGKWTIKKLNTHSGGLLGYPWHAIPPHTPIPPRNIPTGAMRDLYEDEDVWTGATHGEVMGYVNEQIRAAKKALEDAA